MKAILSAPGSRGDVNPMIAIGRELKLRGHEVVISLAQPYAPLALDAGLSVEPVISTERFDELLGDPNIWKPIRGIRTILGKVAAEFMPLHYEVIERHCQTGETVLVSHPLDFASRVYRDLHQRTRLLSVHLAPCMLRTYEAPPRMSPWWFEVSRPEWLVRALYLAADRLVIDPIIGRPVNRFRQEKYGDRHTVPVKRVIEDWWLSPDRVLAMYPDWFAPATKQYTPRLVHCGFPLQDIALPSVSLPHNAPVAFTAGTANRHTKAFFIRAAKTCTELGINGLLITAHPENLPESLPDSVTAIGYTSFAELFPKCRAVVHHGGVGTMSQCFAAGVPQVIRPLAFDQFDHASRIESLGVGKWLRRRGLSDRDSCLTEAIKSTLQCDSIATQARGLAKEMLGSDAVSRAADEIESLAPR